MSTTEQIGAVTLPLLPLPGGVFVPGMVATIVIDNPEVEAAVEGAESAGSRLVLVPRIDGRYASVGVIGTIEQRDQAPGGRHAVLLRGLVRASIGTGVAGTGRATWVMADPQPDPQQPSDRALELAREYRAVLEGILQRRGAGRLAMAIGEIAEPGMLADTAVYSPDTTPEQKVQVLETLDVEQRLELVLGWARGTLSELMLREKVQTDVAESMDRTQREYLLRQQLAAIKAELGEDDEDDLAEQYRAKLDDKDVPEAVRAAVEREIDRLERMSPQSPEHGWIRTWLDTLTELPWGARTDDRLDLAEARAILDADHTGLDDVKERIVEQLAVRKLRSERGLDAQPTAGEQTRRRGSGAILALVGPPGVGKTSLGESVARALDRRFVRLALGGVRDEAEIRGHRRTYVGAQPGRIARALRDAGTMNPVILLDEVDKVGSDWRGDPSSALLEVLDPAQNHTFRDHYLEVDLDLSDVLFIATANVLDTIPGPLLDRMEVVRLDGYTDVEKVAIARDHLLPRQLQLAALDTAEVEVTDEVLRQVIEGWTHEAGVRQLERQVSTLLRKAATRIASGATAPLTVDDPAEWLGRRRFYAETAERPAVPGVATGLAVTGAGGEVLFVEATAMDGEPGLILTGQLGDVMKESASIALSYLRAHADALGLAAGDFPRRMHIHVPAGAVPKDGPSAGVTITAAVASLLLHRPVRREVGMTGEITLQGRVLPIGGVKQKVLAAQRAGCTEVVLPERNRPDLDDVPSSVRDAMTFHFVADVADLLTLALDPAPTSAAAA
ncbi:MAG: endopeptidase La [Egibacteraceae bacterium]